MTLARLQETVNTAYPPTHTYKVVDPPVPTGPLAERARIMEQHFAEFWRGGDRLLDVGCGMGFFSFWQRTNFAQVLAIDIDAKQVEVARALNASVYKARNVMFQQVGFRPFYSPCQFDRIFIGNGPHHLFREASDTHEWIAKLAALSSGLVLTEGPVDVSCSEISEEWPQSFNTFVETMKRHFTLVAEAKTTKYTRERKLMLWRCQPNTTALPKDQLFFKPYAKDCYIDINCVSVRIASYSPVSNGLEYTTTEGWYEKRSSDQPFLEYENERDLFKRHCVHQAFLARCGYMDIDSGIINFFRGSCELFDKGGVIPLARIGLDQVWAWEYLTRQAYKTIADVIINKIAAALWTKGPRQVEQAFQWAESRL